MKLPLPIALFIFLLSTASVCMAEPFQHPGLMHSRSELEFVKQKISAGEEPWKSAWQELLSSRIASLEFRPDPVALVERGPRNRPDIGSTEFTDSASAVYAHALQWVLTDDKDHAAKAIEILNAWAYKLKSVTGHDARLLIGLDGCDFCNAAELLRYTNAGWKEVDQKQFEQLLRQVFYPTIKGFYPTANGNWDASMIQTMIAMGIYLDDREMFAQAVEYYKNGRGNGAVAKYINDIGQCQESGRDQLHVQMGLGYLACACEMAWKQGVDLYSVADNRLRLGFEYTAKYNLGDQVPFKPFPSVEKRYDYKKISKNSRGRFRPIYELTIQHYVKREGLEMPYSEKVATRKRPDRFHHQHSSWGTLMFYGQPTTK